MSRMKVLVVAYGDMTSASARIRTWNRLESINDLIEYTIYSGNEEIQFFDIIYIQKRVNAIVFDLVEKAKKYNIPVVFDIDDAIGMSAAIDLNVAMLRQARHIVVDTGAKKEAFSKYTTNAISIIPDGLDYFTTWAEIKEYRPIECVCTFGWDHNLKAAAKYMKALSWFYRVSYIGDAPIDELKDMHFIKWNYVTFVNFLQTNEAAVIAHGDHPHDRLRCCNRFLSAAFAGVLPITRSTPEYKSILQELDVEFLLINDDPSTAAKHVHALENKRNDFMPTLRKKIWEKYQPRSGGLKLYKVFEDVL